MACECVCGKCCCAVKRPVRGKLAIIVGHTRRAQGARSVAPLSRSEYIFNSDVAQRLYRKCRENGLDCRIFFRDDVGISGAYNQVHAWTSDSPISCAIELHFNAYNGRVEGSETFYDSDPKASKDFAEIVHEQIVVCFGRKGKADRGAKLRDEGRGAYNLRSCKIPSCLVEPFFGDSKEDAKLAHAKIPQYVDALYKAAAKFLEEKKN